MSWRKKYVEQARRTEQVFAIGEAGGKYLVVDWLYDSPDDSLYVSASSVREGWRERIKGAWELLREGYAWAADITLGEETCRWLGELLCERAEAMRVAREAKESEEQKKQRADHRRNTEMKV